MISEKCRFSQHENEKTREWRLNFTLIFLANNIMKMNRNLDKYFITFIYKHTSYTSLH